VARTKDLIAALLLREGGDLPVEASFAPVMRTPIILPETSGVLRAMDTL